VSVEVARRYGTALDEENWEEARELLDPDVEIIRPSGRRYEGADRWIEMLAASGSFENIDTTIEGRAYEQRNGEVIERKEIVHRWRADGTLAYTSREETRIGFREGRIASLRSTVEHHEP
jgi:hypothetical protein